MFRDLLFVVGCFCIAIFFAIMVINKTVEKKYEKQPQIKRTIEMVDPEYDKKHGR